MHLCVGWLNIFKNCGSSDYFNSWRFGGIVDQIFIETKCQVGFLPHSSLSWNFSLAENLESLSFQDGLRSGIIIGRRASQPASQPPSRLFFKVEYLSYQLSEHTKILDLSLYDQTIKLQILKTKKTSNIKRPLTEDELKIL